jgi:Phage terminase large subunit (GpA)
MSSKKEERDLFDSIRTSMLDMDPVAFCERVLYLEGNPYRVHGNGYRPFADIIRYIGLKSIDPDSKPTVIVKGRQQGASVMAIALEMYFMCSGLFGTNGRPPMRVVHAFPHGEMAKRFSKEKLGPMITSALAIKSGNKHGISKSIIQSMLDQDSDTGESLGFKLFKGGNFLRVDHTGLQGDRLRGATSDAIIFDEIQDITKEAIENTIESLKQAHWGRQPGGIQVYFGTPKRKGSNFYQIWQESSQQYFYLGCEKCKDFFPFYTPETEEWKKIWLYGFIVKCTHCGHEQDKREAAERGKWVATRDIKDPAVKYAGFHINQFLLPKMRREDIEAAMPASSPTNTERKFQNEILGEFYQGDATPISIDDIREQCGDPERGMRARIIPGEEQLVLLGLDFGGKSDIEALANPEKAKQGQSYTTACLLTVKGPNLFSIDLALKFSRNDPEHKKGVIENIMRQYSVNLAVGDIGYSNDLSHTLHTMYGDKYLVSRACGKILDKVKYIPEAYPKELAFERSYHISEMYELLKKGQIRFPLKDADRLYWAMEHCCNMEMKPSIPRNGGDPEIHYIKNGPNDFAMALINALLAYKFYITGGFKIKNPNMMRQPTKKKQGPLAILGRIDRNF